MLIRKTRIRNIDRYLKGVNDGDTVVVGLISPLSASDRLVEVGFTPDFEIGERVLPSAVGSVSKYNAEGKYKVHRDKPMETAYRQIEWTWSEWHGPYEQIERSEIKDYPYQRYPRTFLEPPSIELTIATDREGQPVLVTPPIEYTEDNREKLLHTVNLMLELFGECYVLDEDHQNILKAPMKRLNWEVLPHGKHPWERLLPSLQHVIRQQPDGNQKVIQKRFKALNEYEPEFTAVGRAGFNGYLVFGYPSKGLYVLESTEVNNATYILDKDWETLSQMTKAQLINASLHKERVIHREKWFSEINNILS